MASASNNVAIVNGKSVLLFKSGVKLTHRGKMNDPADVETILANVSGDVAAKIRAVLGLPAETPATMTDVVESAIAAARSGDRTTIAEILDRVNKSERRRVRKSLRSAGYSGYAGLRVA